MTTEQIDKARHARPFKPFTLHLADGATVRVKHPELIWRTPNGRTIFVSEDQESAEIIDLLLVTRITFSNSTAKHRS